MVRHHLHLTEEEVRQTGSTLQFRPPTHTPADSSETSSKALGQLLATSSVEHAGKCRKLAGWKGSGNLSTSGECVPLQGKLDAKLSPREVPLFLHFVKCIQLHPKSSLNHCRKKTWRTSHIQFVFDSKPQLKFNVLNCWWWSQQFETLRAALTQCISTLQFKFP